MTLDEQCAAAFLAATKAMEEAQAYFRDVINGQAEYDERTELLLAWDAEDTFNTWKALFQEFKQH
jgi:hypothetical protein